MNFIAATCGASRASTCDGLRPLQRQQPAVENIGSISQLAARCFCMCARSASLQAALTTISR